MIEKVSIEGIATISQGRYLPPGDMAPRSTPEAPIPVWGARGILGYTKEPTFRESVPLVTCRGNGCGLVQWTREAAYISNNAMSIVPNTLSAADTRFLYYALLNESFADVTTGSAQPQITITHLSKKHISWHNSVDSRANVASILGALDDKIELNRKMSATLEAMARALFQSWFVDFDPVRAKAEGRDPGLPPEIAALFPDSFEDSELGEIPKGWRIEHVGSIANASRSTTSPAAYPDETFFHYSIPAFDDGRLPIKQTGSEIKSNKLLVPPGSVLLSRLNPRIPRVWMPQAESMLRSICSSEFAVMVPNIVSREWLYGLFSSSEFCGRFATMVTGTSGSHQRVKPDSLAAAPVVLPLESVVERFSDFAVSVFPRVQHCLSESQTLATLRDALLPKLISGEIRVADAERLVEQSA